MSVTEAEGTRRAPAAMGAAEWQRRVDLAAAHRIAHHQDLSEGIFNHLTAVTPDQPGRFLALPFGRHWSEASASDLLLVDFDGNVVSGTGEVERTAYCIHAPVHRQRPELGAVFHTHMPYASALCRLEDPSLLPIGQTEISLRDQVAYDPHYAGFAVTVEEGERLAAALGDKSILFMANHGVLVVGRTIAEAYDRLYYLERAAQVQLYAMWTGRQLREVPEAVQRRTTLQFGEPQLVDGGRRDAHLHFEALKRLVFQRPPKAFDE
jgi:ribulose-5-phosphate 4-epimerase/fuculose-1-phosphate aldolase